MPPIRGVGFLGRGSECQRLDGVLAHARDSRSAVLVIRGEPTAALDAETEHALFEQYAAGAHRDTGTGRIVVLVSHRFSTVRMADEIIVLDGSRVVEQGSHAELMARNGQYAELYNIQAAAYHPSAIFGNEHNK